LHYQATEELFLQEFPRWVYWDGT